MVDVPFEYEPRAWEAILATAAGAAAALTGLLFVAVSINLRDILRHPFLPLRALETLSLLVTILVLSLVLLAPAETARTAGTEALVIGGAVGGWLTWSRHRAAGERPTEQIQLVAPLATIVAGTGPMAVGGVSLLILHGGGMYWLLGGIVLSLIGAVANAWVLLIEIKR